MDGKVKDTDFKVGDRVIHSSLGLATVVGVHPSYHLFLAIETDEANPYSHDCDNQAKMGYGYYANPKDLMHLPFEEADTEDAVEKPAHYNNGGIECIDYLKDNMSWQGYTGYLEGNTKKYLHRWRYKQKPVEDLKKARWYLDRLIHELTTEGNDD